MTDKNNPTPPVLDDLSTDEKNRIIGAAIDAWLEKKWASFGKWTARGIAAAAFTTIMYCLATHGWFAK